MLTITKEQAATLDGEIQELLNALLDDPAETGWQRTVDQQDAAIQRAINLLELRDRVVRLVK